MRLPQLLLDVSSADYHADRLPGIEIPTLSRSVAEVLDRQSPLHAWKMHPKLGGKGGKPATTAMDRGSFLHGQLLGSGPEVVIIDAPDWRPRKEFDPRPLRDAAKAAGKIPLLPKELDDWKRGEDEVRALVDAFPPLADMANMHKEATLVWRDENGVVWRCRLDLCKLNLGIAWDLKCTEDASEDAIERAFRWGSHALQSSVYEDAMDAYTPELMGRNALHFLFIEFSGVGLRAARPGPGKKQVADGQRKRASKLWKRCLETNTWPGYPEHELIIEATSFELSKDMDHQIAAAGDGAEPQWFTEAGES